MLKIVLLVGAAAYANIVKDQRNTSPQLCKFPEANPSHAQLRVSSDSLSQYK